MNEEEKIDQPPDKGSSGNEENKPYQQPKTTSLNLQTENMEVQKHPHHVTYKNKWAEYLLEFSSLKKK